MSTEPIDNHINEALAGDAHPLALDFVAHLRMHGMQFERGTGYWADKRYWHVKYRGKYVCFILVNGYGNIRHKDEPEGWFIWSDASDEDWFSGGSIDESLKDIAWAHVDICGNCGGCESRGKSKTIFGKDFDNVCRTVFRFDNPNADAVECMKKLVELRIAYIEFSTITACGECCKGDASL